MNFFGVKSSNIDDFSPETSEFYDIVNDLTDTPPVITERNRRHKKLKGVIEVVGSSAGVGNIHVAAPSVDPTAKKSTSSSSSGGAAGSALPTLGESGRMPSEEAGTSGGNAQDERVEKFQKEYAKQRRLLGSIITQPSTRNLASGRGRHTSGRASDTKWKPIKRQPLMHVRVVNPASQATRSVTLVDADRPALPILGESVVLRNQTRYASGKC